MILVTAGPLGPPASRLLARVAGQGAATLHTAGALPAGDAPVTLVVSDGPFVLDLLGAVRSLGSRRFRVLVLSRLGCHPDARVASLQRLWRLEEHVRGGGAPTLTLRFAPLVGRASPMWRWLAGRPALPGGGRKLLNPVHEDDAIETLGRALSGRAAWQGWYEVAGPDTVSLAELRELAAASPPDAGEAACEPAPDELAEHRLAECEPWASHFGLHPTPLAAWARAGVV